MELQSLLGKRLPPMPAEIVHAMRENNVTPISFERKNDLLADEGLHGEAGYTRMEDGTYLVAMNCPMPGITADMIAWWFWWHAQDSWRYRAWYPGAHVSVHYHRKDRAFFEQPSVPAFVPNTQYPVERIGGTVMPLRIDFVTPEKFGFSRQAMRDHDILKIVCGHVSAFDHWIRHTEMAHIFKKTENGLLMISRFWLGQTMTNAFLKKRIITGRVAKDMAEHCCIEYRNLCEILPALYAQYR